MPSDDQLLSVPVPPDARCALHPSSPARAICSRCGAFACAECATYSRTWYCVNCLASAGPSAPLATRTSRFGASILDSVATLLPLLLLGIGPMGAARLEVILVSMVLLVIATIGVQLWAQVRWGQSLGKRLVNIKVVRTDGSDVELWRIVLVGNLVVQVLSQACGVLSLLDVLFIFRDDRRCLHDHLAGTIVVDHPRPP